MKIKKGDPVIVIAGKDKGKKGNVAKALPKEGKVIISGVNVKKVHQRRRNKKEPSQILEISYPIDVSNVAIVDPELKTASRVGKKKTDSGFVRISKKSGKEI
ncbi:MAG: 50S ribosomal protein L24 [Candidatus Paceibacterota bacterium]